jgi:hypothetical protein
MAFLTGWTYRKPITLSRASGAVTNYQMKVLVGESSGATGEDVDCGGLCKTDFSDLRFTTSDGTTLLDYYIEAVSGTTPNQLASVWIEFDSIGTGATTFYMYYGNAGASAVSSGANTFLFFDDFSGSLSAWENLGQTWSIVSGKLRGSCAASTEGMLITASQVAPTDNYAVDAAVNAQYGLSANNYQSGLVINDTKVLATKGKGYWLDLTGYNKWAILDEVGGLDLSAADAAFNAQSVHQYSFRKNGTAHALYVDDALKVSHTYSWPTAPQYVGCSIAYDANYAEYDNFRVRNFQTTEPAWGSWGGQETESGIIVPVLFSQYRRRWS